MPKPHSKKNVRIFSAETGDLGHPLVALIHGSLDRSAGMLRLTRHLHDEFRVLRYDRRGYAKSWPHGGPFDVASQVADLMELLDGRPAVLFGHSYGGDVALATAELLGPQILGVSTYETPLSWKDWWPGTTAGAISVASSVDDAAANFMIGLIGQRRWDELPERTKSERLQEGVALSGELSELRRGEPWKAENIICEVVAGYGSKGQAHHQQGARWISDNVKRGSLVCIESAGHNAHMTHAKEIAQQLVRCHF